MRCPHQGTQYIGRCPPPALPRKRSQHRQARFPFGPLGGPERAPAQFEHQDQAEAEPSACNCAGSYKQPRLGIGGGTWRLGVLDDLCLGVSQPLLGPRLHKPGQEALVDLPQRVRLAFQVAQVDRRQRDRGTPLLERKEIRGDGLFADGRDLDLGLDPLDDRAHLVGHLLVEPPQLRVQAHAQRVYPIVAGLRDRHPAASARPASPGAM